MPRRKSSRRHRARSEDPEPLRLAGLARSESHPDGEWIVRRLAGSASGKSYVCPGCNQRVSAGIPHIVAWPADAAIGAGQGLDQRRHWHTPCWSARDRRGSG